MPMPSLSLSLAGIRDEPRDAIARAATAGFRSVQLDVSRAGLRPRELDRSARRDLSALLRRHGLTLGGLDLWIPEEHFLEQDRVSRAIDAVDAAAELAADLARLAAPHETELSTRAARRVGVVLPHEIPHVVLDALRTACVRTDVRLADHAFPDPLRDPPIGAGVDPGGVLAVNEDPSAVVAALGSDLVGARLSDVSRFGRVEPGGDGGRLDLTAYAIALTTVGHPAPVAVDVRGLNDAWAGAAAAREAWHRADPVQG